MPLAHPSPTGSQVLQFPPAVTPAEADPWEGAPPAQWVGQQPLHNKDETRYQADSGQTSNCA